MSSGCTRPTAASSSNRPPIPVELGERLDVGYVVKGSVRREPDRVRLIVHLIEAQTGEHLWTETYDRALTPENVFAIQEQLAADLAEPARAALRHHPAGHGGFVSARTPRDPVCL